MPPAARSLCCTPLFRRARVAVAAGLLAWSLLAWSLPGLASIRWARVAPRGATRGSSAQLTPFERAEQLREALEGRPEAQRTRREYTRVLEAFRAVYHGDPASTRADASINAVADLLAEEGRVFQDAKVLHDAIGQYEFLRRQYPGSRYRFSALLTQAEIERRDLNDREAAKAGFRDFLERYPGHPLAAQARTELAQIQGEEQAEQSAELAQIKAQQQAQRLAGGHAARRKVRGPSSATPSTALSTTTAAATPPVQTAAIPVTAAEPSPHWGNAQPSPAAARRGMTPPPIAPASQPPQPVKPAAQAIAGTQVTQGITRQNELDTLAEPPPATVASAAEDAPPPPRRGRTPLVTAIRHWSTPVYTRIAIDMQDQVQYEAARVPRPDRIYFDLHGARLSPELIGKAVTVTDDGFLQRIRAAQFSNNVTRIVLDVSSVSDYSAFFLPNPWRLIIDVHGRTASSMESAAAPAEAPPLRTTVPAAQASSGSLSPVANLQSGREGGREGSRAGLHAATEIASLGSQPDRIQATRHPTTAPIAASVAGTTPAPQPSDDSLSSTTPPAAAASRSPRRPGAARRGASGPDDDTPTPVVHEAAPTASGERSLVRALGLKIGRIVIDPGHGGHDSGTLGPGGIQEKEIVLDVSLRLGKLLKQRLGADVIYTRKDDTFIPLETRTALANRAQADLFLSVHANSSQDATARGVETYYLNFTSSPEALEVAARENAVSDQSIHELSGLVKKIALKDKIDESHEFAADVQRSLYDGLEDGNPGLKDRGVKKAPFVVLIGANMPSILAEISFLTNTNDAQQLRDPAYRQRIALSLYRGVARYISGLSGVRLAENSGRPPVP